MSNHLFDAIRVTANNDPKRELILADPGPAMCYGDMLERTALLAKLLLVRGVEPGDRIAAQIDKSTDALMLYLATVRVGAVYLPLNAAYTPAEIDYFIGDAEPRVFVVAPQNQQALSSVATDHGATLLTMGTAGDGTLFDADIGGADAVDVQRAPDDLAAILYTSGTTGRSKGAMLTHDNLLSNAQTLVDLWEFISRDRLIHALPIFHTHGLFVATNTLMLAGASMYLLPRFDAEKILDLMPKATSLMGVPTFYTRLLQSDRLAEASRAMRLFISGSAPLLAATHQQFEATTGHRILERYGMTETNMNTSNPYGSDRRPGTVGPALPGVSMRVADPESGEPLPAGEIGMLEVKGPNVFKGYWRMPEKTASEFRDDGFFITGDLGILSDDDYVTIVGRGKDLVISGGFNIYPKEIETEIDAIEGVAESAVIGVPHPDFGEGLVAVVVGDNGVKMTDDDIIAPLSGRLARFKQPKHIAFVDQLPRNTMGKVQKNVLRETFGDLFA